MARPYQTRPPCVHRGLDAPRFLKTYDPAEILPLFGISERDLLPHVPIETVSTGTPILMIPLANRAALKRVGYPDPSAYLRWKASSDFYFAHHFVLEGATSEGQT